MGKVYDIVIRNRKEGDGIRETGRELDEVDEKAGKLGRSTEEAADAGSSGFGRLITRALKFTAAVGGSVLATKLLKDGLGKLPSSADGIDDLEASMSRLGGSLKSVAKEALDDLVDAAGIDGAAESVAAFTAGLADMVAGISASERASSGVVDRLVAEGRARREAARATEEQSRALEELRERVASIDQRGDEVIERLRDEARQAEEVARLWSRIRQDSIESDPSLGPLERGLALRTESRRLDAEIARIAVESTERQRQALLDEAAAADVVVDARRRQRQELEKERGEALKLEESRKLLAEAEREIQKILGDGDSSEQARVRISELYQLVETLPSTIRRREGAQRPLSDIEQDIENLNAAAEATRSLREENERSLRINQRELDQARERRGLQQRLADREIERRAVRENERIQQERGEAPSPPTPPAPVPAPEPDVLDPGTAGRLGEELGAGFRALRQGILRDLDEAAADRLRETLSGLDDGATQTELVAVLREVSEAVGSRNVENSRFADAIASIRAELERHGEIISNLPRR